MKKVLVLVFVLGVAANSHAEFRWGLLTDFNTSLVSRGIPTGDRTERLLSIGNVLLPNNTLNNPIAGTGIAGLNRGNFTYTTGYLNLFSYGCGQWLRGNELRMSIGFRGDNIEFYTMTLLDALVRPDLSDGSGMPNELGPDHSLVQTPNGARTVNWGDFLRYSFEEYFFRGTVGAFTGFVGNSYNRGMVNYFNAFTDDVLRTIRVEGLGVITPDANADFLDGGQDTNNFLRTPSVRASRTFGGRNGLPFGRIDIPYFMVAVDFNTLLQNFNVPLTLQIAADPGNNSGINAGGGPDSRNDTDFIKMNGAIRLSGENIANWVTFDLIYRFKGGDPKTLDDFDAGANPGGTIQPDGLGIFAHTFGIFANILNVPNFGIGIGYSGYAKRFEEDRETTTEIINRNGPFFHGIDLRLQYTGINRLTITSANNVSFGTIRRSIHDPMIAIGVLGTPLDTGTSQRWVAVYNALGFDYELNERLTASLQIGSRYGVITTVNTPLTGGSNTVVRSRSQIGGGAFITYQAGRHMQLQGGFALRSLNDSYSNNAPGAQDIPALRDASGGMFEFAVPIRMRIVFGN